MHAPGPGPVAYESPQAGDAAATTVPITGRGTGVEREMLITDPVSICVETETPTV